jgi:hypothetical protein
MKNNYIALISGYLPRLSEDNLFKVLTLVKNTIDSEFHSNIVISDEDLKKKLISEYNQKETKGTINIYADLVENFLKKSDKTYERLDAPVNGYSTFFFGDEWVQIEVFVTKTRLSVKWVNKKTSKVSVVDNVSTFEHFVEWFNDFHS